MPRRHPSLLNRIGLSSPLAEADRESASHPAARNGVHVEVKTAADYAGPDGNENVEQEPARLEANELDAVEEPSWQERFASPEEMWDAFSKLEKRFRGLDRLRGQKANEIGQLRAVIEELEERLDAHESIVRAEIEFRKNVEALESGGPRVRRPAGLETLLTSAPVQPAGDSPKRERGAEDTWGHSDAEEAGAAVPESPGAPA